jgi:hypothetical protein
MTRAADDFVAIHTRMMELQQERLGDGSNEPAIPHAPRSHAVSLAVGRSRQRPISEAIRMAARRRRLAC